MRCSAQESREGEGNQLAATVRRKQQQVKHQIEELGTDLVVEQMQNAVRRKSPQPFRLSHLIRHRRAQGQIALLAEVPRLSKEESSSALAERAARLEAAGVDALVVNTDQWDTPSGLQDLFVVVNGVRCPVLRRDWFLHPLQVMEAQQAGAAGVLGIVCQVSRKGTPLMSSFASSCGLDAPIEVVNAAELDYLSSQDVPMYALRCGVGLSLPIPGFAADMTKAMLDSLPAGVPSVVGVGGAEEAAAAAAAGAACLFLRAGWVAGAMEGAAARPGELEEFVESVRRATSRQS